MVNFIQNYLHFNNLERNLQEEKILNVPSNDFAKSMDKYNSIFVYFASGLSQIFFRSSVEKIKVGNIRKIFNYFHFM